MFVVNIFKRRVLKGTSYYLGPFIYCSINLERRVLKGTSVPFICFNIIYLTK